jgi:DNA polymerase
METTSILHLLEWYQNNGIDIPLHKQPRNRLKIFEAQDMKTAQLSSKNSKTVEYHEHPALGCTTLAELKQAMQDYEGCSLKQSAMNLVFADGNPKADLMLVGEAPGADEDRQGLPFVGQSGQLLDRILKAVGFDRTTVYISNIIPWRPPGNRPPTTQEIAACQPFIQKHIELVHPKIVVFLGGVAAKTLLNSTEGIMKLRGTWRDYQINNILSVKALATFHPAYLLRSPGQKALVWRDFLMVEQALKVV